MVLFEVDALGVSVLEFERDAPRSVHMDQLLVYKPKQSEVETGPLLHHYFIARGPIGTRLHANVDFRREAAAIVPMVSLDRCMATALCLKEIKADCT
jgi:hypothetical protein